MSSPRRPRGLCEKSNRSSDKPASSAHSVVSPKAHTKRRSEVSNTDHKVFKFELLQQECQQSPTPFRSNRKQSSIQESSIDLEEVKIKEPEKPSSPFQIQPASNRNNVRMTPIDMKDIKPMTALMQAQAPTFDYKGSFLRSKTNEFQSAQQGLPLI